MVKWLVIVIRDGSELSKKGKFIIEHLKSVLNVEFLYVFRKRGFITRSLREKRHNNLNLHPTSISFLMFLFLMFLNPRGLHDEIIRRFLSKNFPFAVKGGYLYSVSQSLRNYFCKSTQTNGLYRVLNEIDMPKIFLLDEYPSLKVVKLKKLKRYGAIFYTSQDVGYDFFRNDRIASTIMYKLELSALPFIDLVVACSERDRLKYLEMGAKKAVYFPNCYTLKEFKPHEKDSIPGISIVLKGYWESTAKFEEIVGSLCYAKKKITLYVIGVKPKKVPKNIKLIYYDHIPSRRKFLETLSRSWIGINIGIHMGGTNQRKYDYALAGLVVLSDTHGARGDLLPYEYVYVDSQDFAANVRELLDLGTKRIFEMGIENRKHVLYSVQKQKKELSRSLKEVISSPQIKRD